MGWIYWLSVGMAHGLIGITPPTMGVKNMSGLLPPFYTPLVPLPNTTHIRVFKGTPPLAEGGTATISPQGLSHGEIGENCLKTQVV
jgi:hypothetical protein